MNKNELVQLRYNRSGRARYGAVKAKWFDVSKAKERWVQVGTAEPIKVIDSIYTSDKESWKYARSVFNSLARGEQSLSLGTAGNPNIVAESPLKIAGVQSSIDSVNWVIESCEHSINSNGFKTKIKAKVSSKF